MNRFVTALILVVAGIVILGHNTGVVSDYAYRIIISWQMLLIILGISSLLKRNLLLGILFFSIGLYFILPRILPMNDTWQISYWPVFLIIAGLIVFFHNRRRPWNRGWIPPQRHCGAEKRTEEIIDGFVTVNVSFGSSRHIVLDPVFRGAKLDVSCGSIALDLRRTTLEKPETFIDLDCSFGGFEIFVPPNWCLFSELDTTFGSSEDKRYTSHEIDTEHKLIIRGDVSFGALEIKN
jgi:hypothetical protein